MRSAGAIARSSVSVTDVRNGMMAVLKANLAKALEERSAHSTVELAVPRTWRKLPNLLTITETQSPCVYITGAAADFVRRPGNRSAGDFHMAVFCIIRAKTYDEVADRVGEYVLCLRSALAVDPRLDDLAETMDIVGEAYDKGDSDEARTIGGGAVIVSYTIDRAIDPDAT